ncbi:profilin-1 [Chelmon rostratus]|uniref:profilin-1 n=1 Tax=Chelmon rostratus TaxID=109905 RepID=UPI001BEBA369|nr:profilin-1 [Chelmon rostratus]
MSWQSYVQNLMAPDHTGNSPVKDAAICGCEPGKESVWASSSGLANITQEEIRRLAGKRTDFSCNGPHIAGKKCMMLRDRMDDETNYSLDMKTSSDSEGNTFSVCVGKSLNALIIAVGTKEAQGGQVANKVFPVVKYLRENNM